MQAAVSAPLFEAIAPETAGMPLYRVVKRSLLTAIESGHCPPGETLPSETEIAGAMGVSIGTLRRAVDELAAEHILVRRQGRGTFVATHNTDRFLFQFFHVERADGLREAPLVDLVSFERLRADDEPAEALQLRTGDPVIQIENRLRLQGSAVIYDRLTLPSSLFKGLTEKRFRERPGTIYQLYQSDFGISVLRAQERARAAAADRNAVRVLSLPYGQPVMQVRRTALTFGDRPVEHRISIINTAHHDYVNLLSRPAGKHD
ncbi:MAG: GntR family transcriptional regulator [Pseudomonadota bacterium]